jgi:hypothetical protein
MDKFPQKPPHVKFHTNQSSGTCADTRGHTDLTELIGTLGIHWNAPKKSYILPTHFICMCHMITIRRRGYAPQQMVFVTEQSAAETEVLNSLHTKVFTSVY